MLAHRKSLKSMILAIPQQPLDDFTRQKMLDEVENIAAGLQTSRRLAGTRIKVKRANNPTRAEVARVGAVLIDG